MRRMETSNRSARLSFGRFIRCWAKPPISLKRCIALARQLGMNEETDREIEAIVFQEAAKSQQPLFLDMSCGLNSIQNLRTLSVD